MKFPAAVPQTVKLMYRWLIETTARWSWKTQPKLNPLYQGLKGARRTGTTSLTMGEMFHLFITSLPLNSCTFFLTINPLIFHYSHVLFSFLLCNLSTSYSLLPALLMFHLPYRLYHIISSLIVWWDTVVGRIHWSALLPAATTKTMSDVCAFVTFETKGKQMQRRDLIYKMICRTIRA